MALLNHFYGMQSWLQCVFSLMRRSAPGKGAGDLDNLIQTPCTRTRPDGLVRLGSQSFRLCSVRIIIAEMQACYNRFLHRLALEVVP